ncbi:MAG TPA: hypothetical protein VNM72_01590 [Blastocatellia bacterium]|nr:hypothetical protein [Blastocatellia bacterium]
MCPLWWQVTHHTVASRATHVIGEPTEGTCQCILGVRSDWRPHQAGIPSGDFQLTKD